MKQSSYFKSEDQFDVLDIYELFAFYNSYFFDRVLEKTTVEWSQKMTLCAGSCANTYHESCVIKLSAPLLKYRSANEMIHAYLFLTNPRACIAEGGHGRQFKQIMRRINEITGLNVTIYHNFTDEVDLYRKHVWKCNGPCQKKPPFFGYVKRAMNRKPQPADRWFKQHQKSCGGTFEKISGPEEVKPEKKQRESQGKQSKRNWGSGKTLQEYFKEMGGGKQEKKSSKICKNMDDYLVEMRGKSAITGQGKTIAEYCRQISLQKELSEQNKSQK